MLKHINKYTKKTSKQYESIHNFSMGKKPFNHSTKGRNYKENMDGLDQLKVQNSYRVKYKPN